MNSFFDEVFYALALQDAKGVGPVTAKKLISIYGSAVLLYKSHQNGNLKKEINIRLFDSLFERSSLVKAEKEMEKAMVNKIKCLYYQDEDYPKNLLNTFDSPLVLFQDGEKKLNKFKNIISIVGTRNISDYGRSVCVDLLSDLRDYNPLIVSGYALGIDICAHLEALKNDLCTTAVLAHGYGTLYPREHKKYYEKLKKSGGFLSEFSYDESPFKVNFLKRNRIIAGMSQGTIVVESALKGGSLVTAHIANSYNREVFTFPGRTTDIFSKGCNNMIKENKAILISCGEDVIRELNWEKQVGKEIEREKKIDVNLNEHEKKLYLSLKETPLQVDELVRMTKIPIDKISSLIFQLEMMGLIEVLPGRAIRRI